MPNINKIHFIYLIPSDKSNRAGIQIREAAAHLQAWARWQMGNNKTFEWVFAAYQTAHTADWYSTYTGDPNTPHSEWYWANAQTDARDYAGAHFYMEHDSWAVYVDAPILPDQHAGGASVNGTGICVLHQRDVNALLGLDSDWTHCREIGGLGHEALHTLGLPHPPPGPDFGKAIMGTGYMTYPNCILTENDKTTLDQHRFFAVEPYRVKPPTCPFDDSRPRPKPRPRPAPVPRPRAVPPR